MSTPRQIELSTPTLSSTLLFSHLSMREQLGRLFEMQLTVLSPANKPPIQATALLGQSITVKLLLSSGRRRPFNGVVVRFTRGPTRGRFHSYHLELRPKLWYLTRNSGCRIFQDATVVDIIDQVLAAHSLQADKQKLSATYTQRNYCVQYRETDFNFISRLMEEEGIYYYFTHSDSGHTLVLGDSISAHSDLPASPLTYAPDVAEEDRNIDDTYILQWNETHSVQPLTFVHKDFEFQKPSENLETTHTGSSSFNGAPTMEIYDYPGIYDALPVAEPAPTDMKNEGERIAKIRQQEFDAQFHVGRGTSDYREVAIGHTFGLKQDSGTTDWLVTAASYEMDFGEHEASSGLDSSGFICHIECTPKSVGFRSPRTTPRPFVQGPQTALVVSGADASGTGVDKYGRIKVRFHWVRPGKHTNLDSCWLRVSQPWASKGFGMVSLPRVGDEVVVDFLEGDPDRPLVTGRVYNAESMPPYELPAQATVSGILSRSFDSTTVGDANEIRFDDKAGSEYLWIQAQRDFKLNVKNDWYTTVNANLSTRVLKKAWVDVTEKAEVHVVGAVATKFDADYDSHVTGNSNTKVDGDHMLTVGGAQAINVTGAHHLTVTGAANIKSDNNVLITGGSNVHIVATANLVLEAKTGLTIKCGGTSIVLDPKSVSIAGAPDVKINSGGSGGSSNEAQKKDAETLKAPKTKDEKEGEHEHKHVEPISNEEVSTTSGAGGGYESDSGSNGS